MSEGVIYSGVRQVVSLSSETRAFITSHRVARLATLDSVGSPHLVPICYAYDDIYIYSAIDLKPKRVPASDLKRVNNIRSNPKVAILIDDYSEDWSHLAYVMVKGSAVILESGPQRSAAEAMLRDKYAQYRDFLGHHCLVLRVTLEKVVSWSSEERIACTLDPDMSR